MACLIGISCGWRESEARHLLRDEYVRALEAAGAVPVLLPSVNPALTKEYYTLLHGFIFSGGGDVDALYFGEEPHIGMGEITPVRDRFELALATLALQGRKPVLAICRGVQVLNIAAGGTIHQDLHGITNLKHNQLAPRWHPTHQVDLEPKSRLSQLLGATSLRVNSFHHQGIKQVGKGLWAVGRSRDGLVEALESTDPDRFLLGVQWHPECSWERDEQSFSLFKALVNAAGNAGKEVIYNE